MLTRTADAARPDAPRSGRSAYRGLVRSLTVGNVTTVDGSYEVDDLDIAPSFEHPHPDSRGADSPVAPRLLGSEVREESGDVPMRRRADPAEGADG